jgi:hypothetical protein
MARRFDRRRYRADRVGEHARHYRRRRWPWAVLAGTVVVFAAVGGVGYIFAQQAFGVRDDLLAAKSTLSGLPEVVKAGDAVALQAAADDVLVLTTRAEETVQGPLWDMAASVPFVGQNISAVTRATEAVHILARDAMPPGIQLLSTMDLTKLSVEGGGINLDPFKGAIDVLPVINEAFADAEAQVAPIDRSALIPVVDDAIGELLDVMDQAGPALETVEKYLPTILQLAGSDAPKTYIVLFQNNAEIRATGGNAANSSIMRVDNGGIEMLEGDDPNNYANAGYNGQGSFAPAQETLDLYEWDFVPNAQNFTRTPDFPTSAQMYSTLWNTSTGSNIDGVISIDPVVLSHMLKVAGPVTLDDGSQITGDNVVKVLLSDTYERFGTDGRAADAYFAEVADKVFDHLSAGNWDPLRMLDALEIAMNEQRVYAWFPAPEHEAMAVEFGMDGALTGDPAEGTEIGVWANNASYSKLEYYLTNSIAVTCNAEARTVTSALTMTSAVPGSNLSGYTLGWRNNRLGLPRTTMILDTLSFSVPGGTITSDPEYGDFADWTRTGTEQGRAGRSLTMTLAMGETKTVAFTSTVPEGAVGPLKVRYSPTVTTTPVTIDPSCDALFPAAP